MKPPYVGEIEGPRGQTHVDQKIVCESKYANSFEWAIPYYILILKLHVGHE